ncbi:MAG: flagellar hook-length control protein FliK [Treponema sp.]|nr:flagellar hook-length control protein FliK [Treponema sp.]
MSYQAITDIIVAPKTADLLLSDTVKDSPKQSAVSFADFLSEETSSEPKVEQGVKVDAAEKTEESRSVTETKDEKKISKADSEKVDQKEEKSDIKKELPESVKTAKIEKSDKKEIKDPKKISKKDFERLDELTKKDFSAAEITENAGKIAAANQTNAEVKLKTEAKSDKDLKIDADDLLVKADTPDAIQKNTGVSFENKTEEFEFNFSGKNQNEKKEFALDKEGKIKVEDLRSGSEIADSSEKKSVIKTSEIKLTNENTAVMTLEVNPNAEADVLSLNTQTAAADGSNFQAMLSNQLQNVAPEFVKAGNLVLKDNNQGTINLVLHPDDLGNVKIHLSLDGKTLSGHITVATKEALQVFKDNAETLREAFIKSGFETAEFDVAFNNGSQFSQNMDFGKQDDGTNLLAKHVYGNSGSGLDSELEDIFQNAEDISNYSVNIVA